MHYLTMGGFKELDKYCDNISLTHDMGIITKQDQTRKQNQNIFNRRKPTFQRQ